MRRSGFVLLAVLGTAVLPGRRPSDNRAPSTCAPRGGTANGLDDSSPHALLGGVSATAAVSPHVRLGVELRKANLFGPYGACTTRARLVNALMEYELGPAGAALLALAAVWLGAGCAARRPAALPPPAPEALDRWERVLALPPAPPCGCDSIRTPSSRDGSGAPTRNGSWSRAAARPGRRAARCGRCR